MLGSGKRRGSTGPCSDPWGTFRAKQVRTPSLPWALGWWLWALKILQSWKVACMLLVVQLLFSVWLFVTPWTVAQASSSFSISGVCSNSCPPNHLILYVAWLKDNGFRPRFNCITYPEGSDQELFSDDIDPYEALACCLWHFQKWLLPHDCSDKESFSAVMSLRIPNFSERKRGDYKYRLPSISHFLNSCICGHKKKP